MVRHLVSPVALSLTRGSSHITTSLQLAVILGVLHTLATDSVALHRFQVRPVHITFKCPSRVCFNRLLSSELLLSFSPCSASIKGYSRMYPRWKPWLQA